MRLFIAARNQLKMRLAAIAENYVNPLESHHLEARRDPSQPYGRSVDQPSLNRFV